MKRKKLWWLVACLAFALLGLLVFQVRWLLKSAELKENHFRHRVTMALCSAVEELGEDKQVCSALSSCSVKQGAGLVELVGMQNNSRIEEVVGQYLNHYQINSPYEVTISKSASQTAPGYAAATIKNTDNAMIHVDFPTREEFILSELNSMFITSFLLIGLLIVVCVITLQWMFRQQRIQLQTVDYIDGMSHELKTPINNISLALAMLEKQLVANQTEKVRHYMDVAKTENDALRRKISEVLGTASLDKLLSENNVEPCDMHGLIMQAQDRLSVKIEELEAMVEYHLEAKDFRVQGNPSELLNVLVCILDNALTYSNRNLRIRISTENDGESILIKVNDNGIGIPLDKQQQVFEKYYRNDKTDAGYGVGLFLVKKIIESHSGRIDLVSGPEQGSEFIIRLPLIE